MGFGDAAFTDGHDLNLDLTIGLCNHQGVVLLPHGDQIRFYPRDAMREGVADILRVKRQLVLKCLNLHDSDAQYDMPVEGMIRLAEGPPALRPYGWEFWPVTIEAYRRMADAELFEIKADTKRTFPDISGHQGERGIVLVGGGEKYFPLLWVAINLIRHYGCKLPIEVWHLGRHEMDTRMERLLSGLVGVRCINGANPENRLSNGWALKAEAILGCAFQHVIYVDSDNHPLFNVEEIFDWQEYGETGAVFWPEAPTMPRWTEKSYVWEAFGVPYQPGDQFETGQLAVDKSRCRQALEMTRWYDQHADYFYRLVWGDTDTFRMGFLKTATPYRLAGTSADMSVERCMCQNDFRGRRIFQHRSGDKVQFGPGGVNGTLPGYRDEEVRMKFIEELKGKWDGKIRRDG